MGIDKVRIDQMGIDQMGIDQMGIDQMGIDKVGRYPCFLPLVEVYAPTTLFQEECVPTFYLLVCFR